MHTYKLWNTALDRAFLAVPAALLITFALLVLMRNLIHEELRIDPATSYKMDPIIMPEDTPPEIRRGMVKPPVRPEQQPTRDIEIDFDTGAVKQTAYHIPLTVPKDNSRPVPNFQEGEPIPYLRSAPIYPTRQLTKGTEGFVDLQFAITKAGATDSVVVISSQPAGVFDRAAIRAVKKWKYKPQIVEGVAIRKEGVVTRVSFKISD